MSKARVYPVLVVVIFGACASLAAARALAPRSTTNAIAAKVVRLNDAVHMRLVTKHGAVVVERGEATGSVRLSPLVSTFYGVNAERGTATLVGYSHGNSVTGRAALTGYTVGHITHFEGLLSITGGTGSYAHARGHGLRFKGIIDRHDFHAVAELAGTLHQ